MNERKRHESFTRWKVAVVTGCTQGIRFAIAKELVEEGATVVVTGRDQRRLDEAVATIGQKASGVRADAGSPTAMDALLKGVKAARADWRGARDRPGRGVPCERRVELHQWRRTVCRWRVDAGGVIDALRDGWCGFGSAGEVGRSIRARTDRYCLGAMPVRRLNALLNALSDS